MFTTLHQLEDLIDVMLGDGRALTAVGRGEVMLDMVLPNGSRVHCMMSSTCPHSHITSSVLQKLLRRAR